MIDDETAVTFKTAKVYDLADHILISGPIEADVAEALNMLVQEDGAQVITPMTRLGSAWLAACTHPMHSERMCEVRRDGYTVTITGPTERAVAIAMDKILERGARIIEPPRLLDGKWVAVLDEADAQGVMHLP
jgi:hypothetical protein